jgi:hypothetical protein
MTYRHSPLAAVLALGAALTAPIAWAQSVPTAEVTDPAPPVSSPQRESAGAEPNSMSPQPLTWADVDADKDGAISREESAQVESLVAVFDDADADKDGRLTVEEYKAYAAASSTDGDSAGGAGD